MNKNKVDFLRVFTQAFDPYCCYVTQRQIGKEDAFLDRLQRDLLSGIETVYVGLHNPDYIVRRMKYRGLAIQYKPCLNRYKGCRFQLQTPDFYIKEEIIPNSFMRPPVIYSSNETVD